MSESQSFDVTQENHYDVFIVGGGPAAVTAAIYIYRFALKTIMVGQEYGGAISKTYLVENYPGFFDVSGFDLMDAFQKHYEFFKIPFVYETVMTIEQLPDKTFKIVTSDETEYYARAVIVTTGGKYRKLGVPGEEDFHGRGVSYCATCDGAFFRNKPIIVVGGSDSAAVEALFLSKFGSKVSIVYRRDKIRSEPINTKRVEENPKIEIINNTTITRIIGDGGVVTGVEFHDGTIFPAAGVFIEIGEIPQSDLVIPLGVAINEKKEIIVDKFAQTNVPGLFAAGDVTDIREKQVITACGQAVTAAYSIQEYLK